MACGCRGTATRPKMLAAPAAPSRPPVARPRVPYTDLNGTPRASRTRGA